MFGSLFDKSKITGQRGCNAEKKNHMEKGTERLCQLTKKGGFQAAMIGDNPCKDGASTNYYAKEYSLIGMEDESVCTCSTGSAFRAYKVEFSIVTCTYNYVHVIVYTF